MKRSVVALGMALFLTFSVAACQKQTATDDTYKQGQTATTEKITVKVGVSPVPHAEIMNLIKPILEAEGVNLEIQEFTDYVLPNVSLNDKKLDANFFQHLPYLEKFNAENKMDLVSVAKVHIEPMGAYSQKIKSKDEIADGATVAIPNDATNEGRALLLLQAEGLIKLKDESGLTQTPKDIVENPKSLKFQELEAASLPRVLIDVDFAIINTNYALEAKLNPTKDALFIEGDQSAYANILVTRQDNKDSEGIQKLVKALQSEEVKKFLEEKYQGAVVPAF